jgi:hypothetical protein
MFRHMRTTVRLEESLLERARQEAERRGVTLTSLIEQGLELALRRPLKRSATSATVLPECRAGGGVRPGVDLNDSAELLDRLEGRD